LIVQPTAEETAPLVSAAIAGVYLDSLGSVAPRWFSVGAARNIATRIHPAGRTVRAWEDALNAARSSGLSPEKVAESTNLDAPSAALAQGFVKELMKLPAWNLLLGAMTAGNRFEAAFQQSFRAEPTATYIGWMSR
jgi:hypothetical protein